MPSQWRACVAASPNGITSTGSGKRPRTSTHLVSSAITIMRSDAAATIFSRSSAPPPPLIRLSAGSISSAPSTVRSSWSISSSVVSGMPHAQRLGAGRFRRRHADDLHARHGPFRRADRRNASRSSRCRARASCRRELLQARAPQPAVSMRPYSRADDAPGNWPGPLFARSGRRMSSVVWPAGTAPSGGRRRQSSRSVPALPHHLHLRGGGRDR